MSDFYVSATALRRSSGSLQADSGNSDAAITRALEALRAEAASWGQDAPGNAYATGYLPAIAPLLAAALTSGAQVEDVCSRLEVTARRYERTEAENSEPG